MKKIVGYSLLSLQIIFFIIIQCNYMYYNGEILNFFGSIFLELLFVITYLGAYNGIKKFLKYNHIKQNGVTTIALIKGYKEIWGRCKNYYLIFTFKDQRKNSHCVQSMESMTFLPKKYYKGKKIRIAYLLDQPDHPIIVPAYLYSAILEVVIFSAFAFFSAIGAISLVCR